MPTVIIDDTKISSVDGNFETIRKEFNRLASDSLAERYNISPSFINEDGSFSETAKESLFEKITRDELLTVVQNLQKLRGTKEAQQLDDPLVAEADTGGVRLDDEEEGDE